VVNKPSLIQLAGQLLLGLPGLPLTQGHLSACGITSTVIPVLHINSCQPCWLFVSSWAKAKNDRNLFAGSFHSEEAANNWFDLS
jgi:hypothetical protein